MIQRKNKALSQLSRKLITLYSKSLFQKVKIESKNIENNAFNISEIISLENKKVVPDISVIGEELALLRSVIIVAPEITKAFENPMYLEAKKLDLLFAIFPGLSQTMKSFLQVLKEKNHLFLVPQIAEEYQKLLLKFKKSIEIKITTASALDENFGSLLLPILKKLTNANEIRLVISYNPKLLGGFIVEYNSIAIDLSILREFSFFFTNV